MDTGNEEPIETDVTFESELFPPVENEFQEVNPGRFGKRLAQFLASQLPRYGFEIKRVFSEDWGWVVELNDLPARFWIACGNVDGSETKFGCFIQPSRPYVRTWLLRRISTREHVERIKTAIDEILSSEPDIFNVHWDFAFRH